MGLSILRCSRVESFAWLASAVLYPNRSWRGMLRESPAITKMATTFWPGFLARAAEQLGWDESPAGQQKRQEDLALLQELMEESKYERLSQTPGPGRG
jgi:hypothetical protein